ASGAATVDAGTWPADGAAAAACTARSAGARERAVVARHSRVPNPPGVCTPGGVTFGRTRCFMFRNIIRIAPVLAMLPLASCACELIEPGYVGIVVDKTGDRRAISSADVKVGRIWYNP